jgi:hypothetical protein
VLCQAHYLFIIRSIYTYPALRSLWSWLTMLKSTKLQSVFKPKSDDKERLKLAFSNAIGGLQTGIRIIKGIADGVGLGPPGLQVGLSALLFVLESIQVSR